MTTDQAATIGQLITKLNHLLAAPRSPGRQMQIKDTAAKLAQVWKEAKETP